MIKPLLILYGFARADISKLQALSFYHRVASLLLLIQIYQYSLSWFIVYLLSILSFFCLSTCFKI